MSFVFHSHRLKLARKTTRRRLANGQKVYLSLVYHVMSYHVWQCYRDINPGLLFEPLTANEKYPFTLLVDYKGLLKVIKTLSARIIHSNDILYVSGF